MEVFVVIVFVIIGAVVAIPRSRPTKSRRPSAPQPTERPRRSPRSTQPPAFDARTSQPTETTTILRGRANIVDGDTLIIQKTQVRLFGVDAPEINHPYGQKAKWALVALCKGHTVEATVTDTDNYGRGVAKCILSDGRDLSAEMVKQGLAIDWAKFSGGAYRSMETPDARKKLWLADARQKGRMHVWKQFEERQAAKKADA